MVKWVWMTIRLCVPAPIFAHVRPHSLRSRSSTSVVRVADVPSSSKVPTTVTGRVWPRMVNDPLTSAWPDSSIRPLVTSKSMVG